MSILKLKTYSFSATGDTALELPRQDWYLLGMNSDSGTLCFMDYTGAITCLSTSGSTSGGTTGTSGTSGKSGTSGTSGKSGTSGTSGLTGTSGTSGKNGTSGTSSTGGGGSSGTSGTSSTGGGGSSGTSGTGGSGSSGTSGVGNSGSSGTSGISGSSGLSGSDWINFGDVTTASNTTFTVTDNAANQDIFRKGRPIRHNQGSGDNTNYAMITNYVSGTVTIAGVSTTNPGSINIDYGPMSNVTQEYFVINGDFGDNTTSKLLEEDLLMKNGFYWRKGESYFVLASMIASGVTSTAPTFNIHDKSGTNILIAEITGSTSLVSSTLVDRTKYTVDMGDNIEISVESVGTGTGNNRDLTAYLVFVQK